jgi:hypothetical protein
MCRMAASKSRFPLRCIHAAAMIGERLIPAAQTRQDGTTSDRLREGHHDLFELRGWNRLSVGDGNPWVFR